MIFKYKMGGKIQDVKTPFEGTIIARREDFSEEKMYLVQPDGCTDNGQPIDAYWLTEKRLIKGENPCLNRN